MSSRCFIKTYTIKSMIAVFFWSACTCMNIVVHCWWLLLLIWMLLLIYAVLCVLCCCPLHVVLLSSKCCLIVFFMLFCCLHNLFCPVHVVLLSCTCCFVSPLFVVLLSFTSGFVVHCTCPPRSTERGRGSSPLRTTQSCRHTRTLGRSLSLSTAWSNDRQAAG